MAQGVPTPAETVLAFRNEYIRLGNISAAARAVGLPVTTAWDLAERAEDDPDFVAARKRIDARAYAVTEDLVIETARVVADRIISPDLSPAELAAIAVENGLKSFSYQNPKPQYFRGLVSAHEAIGKRVRLDAERGGEITGSAMVIVVEKEQDAATG